MTDVVCMPLCPKHDTVRPCPICDKKVTCKSKEQNTKIVNLSFKLTECSDDEIECIFRLMEDLDFDRIRRKINWLTHRTEEF